MSKESVLVRAVLARAPSSRSIGPESEDDGRIVASAAVGASPRPPKCPGA